MNEVIGNNEFSWISGYRAHDFLLCKALRVALDDVIVLLGVKEQPLHVVVTGDLTSVGGSKEFPVAHSFIRSLWRVRRQMPGGEVGLKASDEHVATVAGNHDQWGGKPLPPKALNPSLAQFHFRKTPWTKQWRHGSLVLDLFGIDSNAGMTGTNWRARGQFSTRDVEKLRGKLERALNESNKQTADTHVRAILTHHSPSYVAPRFKPQFTELIDESQEALLRLCDDYGVTAVLTGHTHDFVFQKLAPRKGYPTELRAASATQGPTNRNPGPGFLVHRIQSLDGHTHWSSWRYGFDGTRFVRKQDAPCVKFAVVDSKFKDVKHGS